MFGWLKRKTNQVQIINLVGPIRFSLERLQDSYSLHINMSGKIENEPGTDATISVLVGDQSVRELYGLLKNVIHEPKDPTT